VLLIAFLIALKVVKLPVSSEVTIEIMQNKTSIGNLDSKKVITHKKRLKVPTIEFLQSRTLHHKVLGKLGFSSNFFINATTTANVLKEGDYRFTITSDDGFRFSIDDTVVCEFVGNRGYESNSCGYHMDKGDHIFKLSYYQGGGPMGLKASYRLGSKNILIGKDSKYIEFKASK